MTSVTYDQTNIFARILRGEIPADKFYENTHALAFRDIHPKAPVHLLVIPKGPYITLDHMMAEASRGEIEDFFSAVAETIKLAGVATSGYRIVSNNGQHGGQEVPHLHFHILGGKQLHHPQQEAE
jgi:histidine triad (HIT) family protein